MDTFKSYTRFGLLHIPKTAGTSLGKAIYGSLGLEHTHIASIKKKVETSEKIRGVQLVEKSMAYKFACNAPFLSGHITFNELKHLKRDFVFTLLRDPRKRLVSLYTYYCRNTLKKKIKPRHADLFQNKNAGFYQFMELLNPANSMAKILLKDYEGFDEFKFKEGRPHPRLDKLITQALRRFDVVYACPVQEVLDDLLARGLMPKASALHLNESEDQWDFGSLGPEDKFLQVVNDAVWLDTLVYELAQRIFPEYTTIPLANDAEFLQYLKSRFGVNFS